MSFGAASTRQEVRARPRSLRAGSMWLLIGKGFQMGAGFLFWIVAARAASVVDVGVAAASVSAVIMCTQIGVLGSGSAVIMALGRGEPPRQTLDTAFTLVTVAATVTAGGYLAISSLSGSEALPGTDRGVFAVLFLACALFGTVLICQDQVSIALHHTEGAATRYAVGGALTLAVVLAVANLLPLSPTGLVACWSVGSAAAVLVGVVQLHRWAGYHYRPSLHLGRLRRMTRIGVSNQMLTLTERLPPALIPVVLAHFASPTATAYWYPAWMMAWAAFTAPISVGMVQFADLVRAPERAREIVRSGVVWSLVLGGALCLVLVVGADVFLSLLGEGYAEASVTALRVLVIGLVPFVVIQAYNAQCRALSRTREATVLGMLVMAAVCVGTAVLAGRGTTAVAVLWVGCTGAAALWAGYRLRVLLRRSTVSAEQYDTEVTHG
jgi:O-antigen/teichoic acid export membrane protein